jgi:hypothetical protein
MELQVLLLKGIDKYMRKDIVYHVCSYIWIFMRMYICKIFLFLGKIIKKYYYIIEMGCNLAVRWKILNIIFSSKFNRESIKFFIFQNFSECIDRMVLHMSKNRIS